MVKKGILVWKRNQLISSGFLWFYVIVLITASGKSLFYNKNTNWMVAVWTFKEHHLQKVHVCEWLQGEKNVQTKKTKSDCIPVLAFPVSVQPHLSMRFISWSPSPLRKRSRLAASMRQEHSASKRFSIISCSSAVDGLWRLNTWEGRQEEKAVHEWCHRMLRITLAVIYRGVYWLRLIVGRKQV